MAFQPIIDATSIDEFGAVLPTIEDLPKGAKILLRIELPPYAPIGKLADLAGMEWWAEQFIGADVRVTDVYGNWHWLEIMGVAEGTPVLLLVTIIIGALSALGIAWLVSRIVLSGEMPAVSKTAMWIGVAAIALVAGGALLTRKRKED